MGISRKQRYAINHATARVNIWDGAIRSGKTHSSILAFLKQFTTPLDDGVIVITGKNADSIYRNVFAPIFSTPALEWAAPFIQYRQGSNTARIFGRTVHVIGANDERAENRIRGMTVRLAYMDEITVLPENFFRQLLGRMSPPGAQLFATTNPDSPSHWFKKQFLDRYKELGWQYFHFEMDDNPALSEDYKNSIKAEYTGLWYDRFILGKWTAAEGAVFSMWNENTHIVEDADLPAMLAIYAAGIDYGTTNPTSAILLGHGDDDRLYLLDEWRIDQSNRLQPYTDAELVDSFHDWHNRLTIKPRYLTVDPAAASFKAALYAHGYRNVKNGDNDVNYGLKLMSNLLATDRLKVTRHCTGFLDEVAGYVWDAKESAKGHDKPVKQNDHCLVPGTLIATSRGDKPIEEVEIGDLVMTRNGWRAVTDAWRTSPDTEVMTVTTSDGRAITGTPNHRVWTENRGWVSLDALRYADILVTWENELNQSSSMESLSGATPTLKGHQTGTTTGLIQDMFATASNHSTVKSGKQYTAPSQTDTTSTTPTTIQATTTHRTLFASLTPTIERTTPTTHAQKLSTSIGGASSNEQPNGTDRPRVGRGTPNTDVAPTPTVKLSHSHVSSAGRLTSPATEAEAPASALTSAKRHGGGPPESTTSSASANGAGLSSPSTSTRAPATARSYVAHVRGAGRSAVYDLTVDGEHEFFANGVLVHNSIDAARYAITTTEALWHNRIIT